MTWMIDELAYAGPEHLDEDFVAGFDRKQGHPDAGPDIAALRAQGLDTTSVVVELGAGTGQFAFPAARAFGSVVAADVSPAMVAWMRSKAPANVTVVRAGFLGYSHEGPPADAVYTRHALHQLPDFWKALALHRIAGLLRPGGVLRVRDLIYDFAPGETAAVFDGWFAGAASDPASGYTAGDYAEHIRTEHSTFRWLFEPMLEAAGFDIVDVSYAARLYGTYTCIRR
jgi:SAM-dependent methyltransferase